MLKKKETGDKYLEAKEKYIELRNSVAEIAANKLNNKKLVAEFKEKTDKWIEDISDRHERSFLSSEHKAVDGLLTSLLQFATHQNLSSLDNVKEDLNKVSVQDSENLIKKHVEEVNNSLQNSLRHLSQVDNTGYARAIHRR